MSLRDFIATIFGTDSIAFKAVSAIAIAYISTIEITEHYIWSPAWTLVFYMFVLTADFVAGTSLGVKREGFKTQKAQRLPAILMTHLLLLGFFFNLPRLNNAIGLPQISTLLDYPARALYWYIILVNAASFVRNAAALGWIKGNIAKWIIKNIDAYKPKITDNAKSD